MTHVQNYTNWVLLQEIQSSTREMVVQMYTSTYGVTKVSTTVKQVEIEEKMVIQMYQYLCDVCTTKLLNTPIQLGSQDVVMAKYRFKEMKGVSSHLLPRRKNGVIVGITVVTKLSATSWSTQQNRTYICSLRHFIIGQLMLSSLFVILLNYHDDCDVLLIRCYKCQ